MKNILLILLCVCGFTNVNADALPTLKIDSKKSFVLNTNDWDNTELALSIVDHHGTLVYEDTILPTERGMKRYNLQLLPKGSYSVVVRDEYKTVKYDISVSEWEVSSISEGMATFYPQIFTSDNNIDINLLSLSKKVKISLVDEAGNVLYGEKLVGMPTVTKRLNIAKLEKGEYSLRVSVGDNYYTQIIKK